jgi:wobble nucleotide-excising tRNase
MSEQGERIARLEAENKFMQEAIRNISDRLSKVEKTIWGATGALALVQIAIAIFKH